MADKDFLKLIKKQRSTKKNDKFEGTLLNYLQLIKENPEIVKLAHKTLYDVINNKGCATIDVGDEGYRGIFNGDKIRVYDYFNEEFFDKEMKRGIKEFKDRFIPCFGTIAVGIQENEPILSAKQLEKDLTTAKKHKCREVIIFRLGGLNEKYVKVLERMR